jgi:hypothetical protein
MVVMVALALPCAYRNLIYFQEVDNGEPSRDDGRSAPCGTLRPDVGHVRTLTGHGPLILQDFVRNNAATFTASPKAA